MRRERRLPGGTAFDAVFREGTVANSPFFVVRYRRSAGDVTRWGFAVGKKLAPKAVDRNLLRRRLKSAAHGQELGALDVVVVAKAALHRASYAEMETELHKVGRRVAKQAARL